MLTVEKLAEVLHGATSAIERPDGSKPVPWDKLAGSDKDLAVLAIAELLRAHPLPATAEEYHDLWRELKEEEGWEYGETYSEEAMTHPSLVPYDKLSDSDKVKDKIWVALIQEFSGFVTR